MSELEPSAQVAALLATITAERVRCTVLALRDESGGRLREALVHDVVARLLVEAGVGLAPEDWPSYRAARDAVVAAARDAAGLTYVPPT